MNKTQALKHFLENHTLDEIDKKINGELSEYSTWDYTAFFGNGELILCSDHFEAVYVVDRIGFNKTISEF